LVGDDRAAWVSAGAGGHVIATIESEVRAMASLDRPSLLDNESDLPPGEPVVGNDVNTEPGEKEPLDDAPVPTLTEPGDTNGG
jgi:hypothetical protein